MPHTFSLFRSWYSPPPRSPHPLPPYGSFLSWFPNDIPAASVLSTIPQSLEQQWNDRPLSGLFFDTVRLEREQYKVSEVHVRIMIYYFYCHDLMRQSSQRSLSPWSSSEMIGLCQDSFLTKCDWEESSTRLIVRYMYALWFTTSTVTIY